jgi:hypothetical protein
MIGQFTGGLGSIEGHVYSRVPVPYQRLLLPEAFVQTFLLSIRLLYWINGPKKWLNWALGVAFFLVFCFPVLGLMVTRVQVQNVATPRWGINNVDQLACCDSQG